MQEEEQRKIAESLNEHNVESDANKRQTQVFMKSEKSSLNLKTINDREEKLPIINIQQFEYYNTRFENNSLFFSQIRHNYMR